MKTSKRKRSPKSAPVVEALDVASAPAAAESAAPVVTVEVVAEPANEPIVAEATVVDAPAAAESNASQSVAAQAVAEVVAPESAAAEVAAQSAAGESVAPEVTAQAVVAESVAVEAVASETVALGSVAAEAVASETVATESVVTEAVTSETGATEADVTKVVAAEAGVGELGPNDETIAVEAVVADQPVAAASVEPVIVLAANCSVKDAAALKTSLCAVANESSAVTLDASAVERVDTATMQLLCAFVRDRSARNQSIVWRGQSQALHDAVRLLGVGALLGFEGAAA